MSAQPQGYPLRTTREYLARMLEELHVPYGMSEEDSRSWMLPNPRADSKGSWHLRAGPWCLIEAPLDIVMEVGSGPGAENDPEKARSYARRLTPFPPIVIDRNRIVDGYHRITAAYWRGDKTIWAYVPCDCVDAFLT